MIRKLKQRLMEQKCFKELANLLFYEYSSNSLCVFYINDNNNNNSNNNNTMCVTDCDPSNRVTFWGSCF